MTVTVKAEKTTTLNLPEYVIVTPAIAKTCRVGIPVPA